MKCLYDGYNYIVRLDKGEHLVESLIRLAIDKQIPGGWVSGIGAALWCELGYFHLDSKQYSFKRFDSPAGALEIIGLQGSIAWTGDAPAVHLHGTFSDEAMQCVGGHVKELAVAGTCELFIHPVQGTQRLTRFHDEATNLNLLEL